ncbi:MAG TPA: 6-phosphogluconolactonase [Acidimicrobiia bacterium]|nr:6-phosphogluconolactonase [Acidimicrobiia bacterium]
MSLFGELRTVDDVPAAFAALLIAQAPRSIALSGGGTAERCYTALAGRQPDWSGVEVYYGDERWVPLDDPDSNAGMVHRTLAGPVGAATEHPMFDGSLTIDEGAAAYGRLLRDAGPVDFVHVGMGPDGHTCSLFPGSPQLDEQHHRVVPAGDDKHPHPRLTVTYPWLETARLVVFTVAGAEKRDALTRVRAGEQLPAARVRAHRVVWLADPAATG